MFITSGGQVYYTNAYHMTSGLGLKERHAINLINH